MGLFRGIISTVIVRAHPTRRRSPASWRMAVADRDTPLQEPQIPLRRLPRLIRRTRRRIRRHEQRSQLTYALLQDRDPTRPTDPFRDHRRRDTWIGHQQPADLRLERIDRGALCRPRIARRFTRPQRGADRVSRDPVRRTISLMAHLPTTRDGGSQPKPPRRTSPRPPVARSRQGTVSNTPVVDPRHEGSN